MSELIAAKEQSISRRNLLLTVSAAALMTSMSIMGTVRAAEEDESRPTVWIELGGQLDRIDRSGSLFAPGFVDQSLPENRAAMLDAQKLPRYGIASEGKINFTPEGSDWVFSAGLRYGRSNGGKHLHHEITHTTPTSLGRVPATEKKFFGDGQTLYHDSHLILDFMAGKDVGLGMFGSGSSSVVSAGVRFAQFSSSAHVTLHARPYLHLSHNNKYPTVPTFAAKYNRHRIDYAAQAQADRSTHGIGPSLSWDGSVPVLRRDERASFNVDWGMNAALLFGRQKTRVHEQTSSYRYDLTWFHSPAIQTVRTSRNTNPAQSRTVTIPNVGGFAGLSFNFPNAKLSVGYRADFFFNAVDQGYDTRKSSNIGYYGPFASVRIGLGG